MTLIVWAALLLGPASCWSESINTIGDLKTRISLIEQDESACIRLLHREGVVGCGAHEEGSLFLYNGYNLDKLRGPTTLVADESLLPSLIPEIQNQNLTNVKGIMVVRQKSVHTGNQDAMFPQSQYALTSNKNYQWNSRGSGKLWEGLWFNIQYMTDEMAQRVLSRATSNDRKGNAAVTYKADLDATMSGKMNSTSCLKKGQCDPLGGYSVLGWMPKNTEGKQRQLPTTLVVAQMDGIGLIHDKIMGADSPLSGMVALLFAMQLLGSALDQTKMSRRIAFIVLAGEPWGYIGSKQFLWQLDRQSDSVNGLTLDSIDHIIELGSLGRIAQSAKGSNQLFLHSQPGYGDTSKLQERLKNLGTSLQNLEVSSASQKNPGIPPSSLMSFLRINQTIKGLVLTEFDREYSNSFYATPNDQLEGINFEGLALVTELLTKFLADQVGQSQISMGSTEDIKTQVQDILTCVAKSGSLFQCKLAKDLIMVRNQPSNYVGIVQTLTKDAQDPDVNVKNDMARFVWSYLANATSSGKAKTKKGDASGCSQENSCEEGAVCVGFHVDQAESPSNGQCHMATVRFIESYPTSLQCKDCEATSQNQWSVSNASLEWDAKYGWPEDPIWTESRWEGGVPKVEVFQEEFAGTEKKILYAGLVVTCTALLLSLLAKNLDVSKLSWQRIGL